MAAVFLWTYRIVGTIIILLAALVLFVQTDTFRGWATQFALDTLNEQLIGKVVVDDISIDLFRGVVLVHPRVYADGQTVLEADSLIVRYDVAPLLRSIIVINEITLRNPQIYIQRRKGDSTWNVERIVKPNPDTTSSPLPDYNVVVRLLRITGGKVYVNDMNVEWPDTRYFSPTHISVRDLELRASARADLTDEDFSLAINRLSYTNVHSPFNVRELVTSIRVWHGGLSIPTLSLKTDSTDLGLRAELDSVDVFGGALFDSMRVHPMDAYLAADRVWGPDITYFLRELEIRDAYTVHSDLVYDGRDLKLNDVAIRASNTELFGDINIMYVDNSRPMFLDAVIINSTADYSDLRRRLPFIPMPELPFISQSKIDRIHMRGAPEDSLWFEVHVSDRPGRFDGEWSLYLRGKDVSYKGNLAMQHGQLNVFLPPESKLDTDLNGRIIVDGTGFEPETMKANVNLQLDRSTVSGYVVRKTALLASADGEGNIMIDTLDLELPPIKPDTVDTLLDVANTQYLSASGVLHAQDLSRPKYEFNISTRALDLAGIFGAPGLPHRITADVAVDAQGFELDSLLGTVTGRVREFALEDRALLPFNLTLISRRDSMKGRHLELQSSFASITATGQFVPSALFSSVGAGIQVMVGVVSARLQHFADSSQAIQPLAEPLTPVDVRFVATVDDPVPLNAFFPPGTSMSGGARMVGRIAAGTDTLYVDIDTARVQDLVMQVDSTHIESDPLEFRLNARLRDLQSAPKVTSIALSAKGDSLLRINDLYLVKPQITMSLGLDTGSIVASSEINDMSAYLAARARFSPTYASLDIDSAAFQLDTAKGLAWHTAEPSIVEVNRGVYTFKGLKIVRDSSELVGVTGRMSLTRFDSLHVTVENFALADITRFVPVPDDNPLHFITGMLTSADVKVNGTWRDPDIDVKVKANDIAYNEAFIGNLNAEIQHRQRTVTGAATIDTEREKDTLRTLDLKINTIGLDLGFTDVAERLVPGKPVDIQLEANDLSLAAAEPFLPAVERVRGTADAKVAVEGTSDKMTLTGKATFEKASFRTQATNVYYVADGSVSLNDERLVIDTMIIRNVPRDYRARVPGVALATGYVQFDGLTPQTIDFTVRTRGLTVMNSATAAKMPTIYGDLSIATGANNPIHMYGSIDAPTLDGDIHVLYGDLTMPKERSSTSKRVTSFDYTSSGDSANFGRSIFDLARPRGYTRAYRDSVTKEKVDSVKRDKDQRDSLSNSLVVMPDAQTKLDSLLTPLVKKQLGGMIDNMDFNLNIWFDGPTLLTMELGSFETLVADIGMDEFRPMPLRFSGRFIDNSIDLSGKLRVIEGESEYFFLKTFKAGGVIDFDRGGLADPALNLTAKYRGSRQTGDAIQDFEVHIDITGTKNKPELKFKIYVAGELRSGTESEITADAITLIVFGRTSDEMNTTRNNLGSTLGDDATSLASTTVLSSVLSDLFGSNPAIRSVSFEQGRDPRDNRLVITGILPGGLSYRLSNSVTDPTGSNTLTVSIPFSVLGDAEALKYFMIEFGRSVTNQAGNVTRNDRAWEIKVGARLP